MNLSNGLYIPVPNIRTMVGPNSVPGFKVSGFGSRIQIISGMRSHTTTFPVIVDVSGLPSPAKLAKFTGISPVSYSSGDKEKNIRNKFGNRTLYYIIQGIAARNISAGRNKNKPVNDIFYEYYNKKISQGKTSNQALKAVMRRIVNIIYGLMKSGKEYAHPESKNITG